MIPRILCACLLCFALTAQAQTYEECASNPQMPNLQKTEEFILIAEGKYGDEYSYGALLIFGIFSQKRMAHFCLTDPTCLSLSTTNANL